MLFITLAISAIDFYFYPAILAQDWTGLAVSFVAVSVAIAFIQSFTVIAVKWLLMGVYKPGMQPMWSWWAMRRISGRCSPTGRGRTRWPGRARPGPRPRR